MVDRKGNIFIVGLGPGERALMTGQAQEAICHADVVIGYEGYFRWISDLVSNKECIALPLTQEMARAELAVQRALEKNSVCVVSSGDPGIYGMASLVLEVLEKRSLGELLPDVVVIPGVSTINACASLLGAPLGHDFAVVSLSDLLTPWATIERRFIAAAEADFVMVLLNPKSQRRAWQYPRAQEILLRYRPPDTPVGVVQNAYRPLQSITLTTVSHMHEVLVDMFTTVIVGNSRTRRFRSAMVTPRGYPPGAEDEKDGTTCADAESHVREEKQHIYPIKPEEILAKSFCTIEEEVGKHNFDDTEWQVVRRMIHASGDTELAQLVRFHNGAAREGVRTLQQRAPIVTDVQMVASGIHRRALHTLGIRLHCFVDDPDVHRLAQEKGLTRSYCGMKKAVAQVGEAVYVIGNAPTALWALCEAVRQGLMRPFLVVAMPVGFVSVVESKKEALSLDVPVITVRGRKGGSAVAAAAVNALLLMATQGSQT